MAGGPQPVLPARRGIVARLQESPRANACLVWSAFLLSRLFLLCGPLFLFPGRGDGDVLLYARYAHAYHLALARGTSVYDYCQSEYPHLALVVMALPRLCAMAAPTQYAEDPPGLADYRALYRVEMALFDLLAFVTMLWLSKRLFPGEPVWLRTERLLAYVGGGFLLGLLLYTRLDVVMASLVLVSLALLVSRLHYAWSFAVLAVAVNFKLVPIILVPVWVLASLPPALAAGARGWGGARQLLAACCRRSAVAGALIVALFVPVYLSSGERCLAFYQYHKDRGLEIGSLYSSLVLGLKSFGYPGGCNYSYGCINVDSPAAPFLIRLAPYITLGLLLAATLFSFRVLLRPQRGSPEKPASGRALVGCTSLLLLVFIAGNKVFSPQYLIWLLPFLPLLPLPPRPRRLCLGVFALVCVLTTVLVLTWRRHVVGNPDWLATMPVNGPTGLGVVLLWARNLAFVGLTLLVTVCLARAAAMSSSRRDRRGEVRPRTPTPDQLPVENGVYSPVACL